MAFDERVLEMMRVIVKPGQVLLQQDRFGNCQSLNGIPPAGSDYDVISARWLPNEEVEVVFGSLSTREEGEVRHYTSNGDYYNV